MVTYFWMEDSKQALKLIHLHLQHLKLIDEDFFEANLHQVLKNTIS